jgi:phosphatidylinositol-3-phosphatase
VAIRRRPGSRRDLGLGVSSLLIAATFAFQSGAQMAGAAPRRVSVPQFSRVVVIVMENKSYDQIVGNPDAPYLNGLISQYGLATQFYATRHPSLPNYLALVGGSTFKVHNDCSTCTVGKQRTIVDQMEKAGVSWKAYMSSMPSPCYTGPDTDLYVRRHNPFMYFTNIEREPTRCQRIVPLDELAGDIQGGTLPTFVWITPNLCEDMHDCPVSSGDQFLSGVVPSLLDTLGPSGALFITFDESEGHDRSGCCDGAVGGHIATIVAGPGVAPGTLIDTPMDHYSILQTIEDGLGLPRLRKAGCACTPSMGSFFSGPRPSMPGRSPAA